MLSTLVELNMDSLNLHYSTKNIPIANTTEYKIRLLEMTEKLIKRMRWKAYFHLNPNSKPIVHETFGFKPRKSAPAVKEMLSFETELIKLIQSLKFKPLTNPFQEKTEEGLTNNHQLHQHTSKS